jgi:anaerobic magnesium-protoporphyrin IX monomethyl ester cyclase
MNNVLLTHSYFYRLDSKQWKFKQPYAPLGTLLAASIIQEAGLPLSFHDSNLEQGPAYIFPILKKEQPKYFIIYDDGFNYLTKMCLTAMREAAFKMIEEAKKNECIVIVNSSDSTDHYEKYLAHGADFIIRGEGEETLKELLTKLDSQDETSSILGIAFSKNKNVMVNAPRPVLRNLDSLPLPAWSKINLLPYRKIWTEYHGYFSLNIATTRGCPFKCNWCAKPIYGNRYNSRSVEKVIDEIQLLTNYHSVDHFWICDDIFGLKPGWIQNFRDKLKEKKLKIRYKIQSRVDLLLQEDTAEALAQSGAETVWVGAESGSQKILDAMDKGTSVNQIEKATALLKAHGIKTGFFLQFGYLGETKKDIQATLDMVLKLIPDEIGISVSYPLPGTMFYEKVKTQLHEKKNWTDSDDLAMMFHGTYGSAFYKVLHRYVHNRYRIARGWRVIRNGIRNPLAIKIRPVLSMLYHLPISLINRMELKRLELFHG